VTPWRIVRRRWLCAGVRFCLAVCFGKIEHAKMRHRIHPALLQSSMPASLFTTFVWPGRRTHYLGGDVDQATADLDQTQLPPASGPRI
jgi:hypothetical protein